MENMHYISKSWYIVRLNFLCDELVRLPVIVKGKHGKNIVLRVYSAQKKYVEVSEKSKKWAESFRIYQIRQFLEAEIETLRNELYDVYGITYEKEKSKYVITKNIESKLNSEFFNHLKDNDCTYPNENDYVFEGHRFRSRLEMVVAQVASDMHLTYKYDCGINLYTKKCYGDFFFAFPEFNRCACLEIMGSLDNPDYIKGSANKFFEYSMAGYLYGVDWFTIGATSTTMPTMRQIKEALAHMVNALSALYVQENKF